jgi:hypothetical protein
MRPAFPASDYYGGSAPAQWHQLTLSLPYPQHEGEGATGGFPRSLPIDRRDRRPASPLRACRDDKRSHSPRDPTTALPPSSGTGSPGEFRGSHAPHNQPKSTGLEPTASLEGIQSLVHSRFAAPSRLPHPRSPVVPPRHGFVRAAFHPHPQLRDQAALSYHQAAAATQRRGLSPRSTQQRLVAHLLIHAQHDGTLGRVQIEPDDIADLVHEQRAGRELERLDAMRLQAKRPPDP